MPSRPSQPVLKIAVAALVAVLALGLAAVFLLSGSEENAEVVQRNEPVRKKPLVTRGDKEGFSDIGKGSSAVFADNSSDERFASFDEGTTQTSTQETEEVIATNTEETLVAEETVESEAPLAAPRISGPRGDVRTRSPRFSFQVTPGAITRCSLNAPSFRDARVCGGSKSFQGLGRGKRYALRVWQTKGERISPPAVRVFRVLDFPAAPKITSTPPQWTNSSSVSFSVRGDNLRCSLQSSAPRQAQRCTDRTTFRNLQEGRYVFRAWQELEGMFSRKPARHVFHIDRTAPEAPTILSGPVSGAAPQVFLFSGETAASFLCSLGEDSPVACASPYSYNLSEGEYVFKLWQKDRAGNLSTPAEYAFLVEATSAASAPRVNARDYVSQDPSEGAYSVEAQETSENSTIELDVLAAIELGVPSDDEDSVAPLTGGATNANVLFSSSADLRSNLSWQIETELSSPALQGGSTGTRGLLSNFDLGASGDSGLRNSNNAAQTYTASYDQDVSWGDEAGTYSVTATHIASQTLGE